MSWSWGRQKPSVWFPDEVLEELGVKTVRSRVRELEAALAKLAGAKAPAVEDVAAKLNRGQPVSRREAAAFLGVSTKKLQRMEATGALGRCSGYGTAVKLAARDILRLASANGKER